MSINVFEGAKRTKLVAQALIVAAAILIALGMPKLPLSLSFETNGPIDGWKLADRSCDPPNAVQDGKEIDIGYSEKVSAVLCFRAMEFQDGQLLIPYQRDDSSTWGDRDVSANVVFYKINRQATFTISDQVRDQALYRIGREVLQHDLHNIQQTGVLALYGCVLLEVLFWCVVWIMSGFRRPKHS